MFLFYLVTRSRARSRNLKRNLKFLYFIFFFFLLLNKKKISYYLKSTYVFLSSYLEKPTGDWGFRQKIKCLQKSYCEIRQKKSLLDLFDVTLELAAKFGKFFFLDIQKE